MSGSHEGWTFRDSKFFILGVRIPKKLTILIFPSEQKQKGRVLVIVQRDLEFLASKNRKKDFN